MPSGHRRPLRVSRARGVPVVVFQCPGTGVGASVASSCSHLEWRSPCTVQNTVLLVPYGSPIVLSHGYPVGIKEESKF